MSGSDSETNSVSGYSGSESEATEIYYSNSPPSSPGPIIDWGDIAANAHPDVEVDEGDISTVCFSIDSVESAYFSHHQVHIYYYL